MIRDSTTTMPMDLNICQSDGLASFLYHLLNLAIAISPTCQRQSPPGPIGTPQYTLARINYFVRDVISNMIGLKFRAVKCVSCVGLKKGKKEANL